MNWNLHNYSTRLELDETEEIIEYETEWQEADNSYNDEYVFEDIKTGDKLLIELVKMMREPVVATHIFYQSPTIHTKSNK